MQAWIGRGNFGRGDREEARAQSMTTIIILTCNGKTWNKNKKSHSLFLLVSCPSFLSFFPTLSPLLLPSFPPSLVAFSLIWFVSFLPSFLHSSFLFLSFIWFFDELWSTPPTCHAWLTNHHGYCASASVATSSTRLQQSLRVAGEMIQWHAWWRLNFSNSNGKPKLGLCRNLERTERWRLWRLVGSQTLTPKEMRS